MKADLHVHSKHSDRHRVLVSGDYSVYVAGSGEIPRVLREIGRLREMAFRVTICR